MNILLIAKLANHTLNENILAPLLKSFQVNHIYVLRDYPGDLIHEKVTYLCEPKPTKGKIRHIKKLFNGISYCTKYKIDAIVGVLLTPHGYIGKAISIFTGIPYVHVTIAGHREYWINGGLMERINIAMVKGSNAITVTGEQTKNYLKSKGVESSKIAILPNLPNHHFMNISVPPEKQRVYDIVSFSRIDKNKNIDLLLRAIARIKDSCTVKLIIAGDGSELSNIRECVKNLELDDNVEFVGYISQLDDKIRIYSNSKIFISCSKGEGFPVSLLEAMSCGCVPIVSNVGDIVDVIRSGENGFVFNDTDNEMELAGYLKGLLDNQIQVESMSQEAQKIRTHISVDNNGKIWDGILSKIEYKK